MEIDWRTVNEVLECAESWDPDARLIGNVRAGDIATMCRAILAEGQKPSPNTQSTSASQIADKLEIIASSNGVPYVLFKRINRLCRQLRTL